MSYKFVCYPTPLDALVVLSSDDGFRGQGTSYVDENGRPGQLITVASTVPTGHGATLEVSADGYESLRLRGFLMVDEETARLQVDDFILTQVAVTPLPPDPGQPPSTGPNPNANPMDIIMGVYNQGANLATHTGCGLFAEDCCKALHEQMHPAWGHIKKNPGQNQFNSHAVDAIMLMVPSGGTVPGIYDIIRDSVSPNATPVFNYVEPPNPELWFYPPAPLDSRGVDPDRTRTAGAYDDTFGQR